MIPLSNYGAGAHLCLLIASKLVIICKVTKVLLSGENICWRYPVKPFSGALIWKGSFTFSTLGELTMGVPLQWISSGEFGMEGRGRGPGAPGLRGLLEQVNLREFREPYSNLPTEKLLGFKCVVWRKALHVATFSTEVGHGCILYWSYIQDKMSMTSSQNESDSGYRLTTCSRIWKEKNAQKVWSIIPGP